MLRSLVIVTLAASLAGAQAHASGDLPTMEDAGYAYEATLKCDAMIVSENPTRRLKRRDQFQDGRRSFRNAAEKWGLDWACKTAFENHGNTIDLSEYSSGNRIVQPLPSELPPVPTFQLELVGVVTETTETTVE